jgi:hypothetical protein
MKNCIAFYNFGNKCILELLVATYSLRKHYTGDIVWMLANNDEWNKQVASQVDNLKVTIKWVDLNLIKRNAKSAVKPFLFDKLFTSGYDSVLMCDGDLLFLKPIDELWSKLAEKGVLLTQFCNWVTKGKIMKARIEQMRGLITDADLDVLIKNAKPAVNIGVMGFTKERGLRQLKVWDALTEKLAGKHIADEVAAHALLLGNVMIAPPTFNASAKIGDLSHIEDNYIVHYHGSAQGGGDTYARYGNRRRSSRLWFAHLYDFYNSGLVPEAKMWEQYATGGVYEVLQANPNLPFECSQEFKV